MFMVLLNDERSSIMKNRIFKNWGILLNLALLVAVGWFLAFNAFGAVKHLLIGIR